MEHLPKKLRRPTLTDERPAQTQWKPMQCAPGKNDAVLKASILINQRNQTVFKIVTGHQWLYQCWLSNQSFFVLNDADSPQEVRIYLFPSAQQGEGHLRE